MHMPDEGQVKHALRTVRGTAYRIDAGPDGVLLSLVMRASVAGRRTAATRIVGLLDAHGLALDAADPVGDLLATETGLRVRATG